MLWSTEFGMYGELLLMALKRIANLGKEVQVASFGGDPMSRIMLVIDDFTRIRQANCESMAADRVLTTAAMRSRKSA